MAFTLWRLFFPLPDPPLQSEIQPTYKHMRNRHLVILQLKKKRPTPLRRTFIVAHYSNTTYREPQRAFKNELDPVGDFGTWTDN